MGSMIWTNNDFAPLCAFKVNIYSWLEIFWGRITAGYILEVGNAIYSTTRIVDLALSHLSHVIISKFQRKDM